MENTQNSEGLFIQAQKDLTEDIYTALLIKPKHKKINKEMSDFLEGFILK